MQKYTYISNEWNQHVYPVNLNWTKTAEVNCRICKTFTEGDVSYGTDYFSTGND